MLLREIIAVCWELYWTAKHTFKQNKRVFTSHLIYSDHLTIIHTTIYKHAVILPHVSAFFGHAQGGTQQRKIQSWLYMSQTCNGRFKIQILKWLKRTKNKVHCVSYELLFDCKQTSVAENHVRFHGYITVSLVVVYITTDECTFDILQVTAVLHTFTAGL